jgi:natural product biosynthesis luciferase-like monooxygenase protein
VNAASWQTAGALGVNVLTALLEQSVDAIAGKVALYRSALAAAGHTADGRQITCMLHTHLAPDPQTAVDRVREPLRRYLSAHLNLFTKFASTNDVGVRPEEVSAADRDLLLDHGVQRYVTTSGLFGSVGSCLPMVEKLTSAGVTELGCLVDFGLPREQVLESVAELGALRERLRHEAARR